MSTQVTTGKVRFSYANVFTPKAINGGTEKYSVSLLIDKDDEKTLNAIKKAIEAAKIEGKGKWGGKVPGVLKMPLRDGDEERPDDEAYNGKYFINANAIRKPGIVDRNREAIIDPDEFYSGCYGRAAVSFYAFNSNGNKGIACGLNHVQKLSEGERLSGGISVDDAFGEEPEDDELLG